MKIFFLLFMISMPGLAMNEKSTSLLLTALPPGHDDITHGKEHSFFKPDEKDIKVIEEKLSNYLKAKHPELSKKAPGYYKQFAGLEIKGPHKVILVNYLCRAEGSRWKQDWI